MTRRRAPSQKVQPPHRSPAPSPSAPSREDSKRETREALVRAAIELFSEQGLDAPSLDAICERAGKTRGAFYVHFATRDDLLAAAMERRNTALIESFLRQAAETSDGEPDVGRLVQVFAKAVDSGTFPPKDALRPAEFLGACARSQRVGEAHRQNLDVLRNALTALVAQGQGDESLRRDVDPRVMASLLMVIEAGVEIMLDVGFSFDAEALGKAVTTMIVRKSNRA
jgi:TetR/AcrR family transcriptional repressor of nem operon